MVTASHQSIESIGEFGLIDRIRDIVDDDDAVIGIGDDCAVLDQPGENYLLLTTDMLVEGVHFRREHITAFDLGRRALAINTSDIAAMGGAPRYCLMSLALPAETEIAFVEEFYRGLQEQAHSSRVAVVGGNITRTAGGLVIDVSLVGDVPKDQVVLRSGAVPGDVLVVSGTLGESTIARLARSLDESKDTLSEGLWKERVVPDSRVQMSRLVATNHLAHAMIDISDGLASDVHHLTEQSDVGAVIYERELPISDRSRRVAARLGLDMDDVALSGGEDYELLFAVPESSIVQLRKLIGVARVHVVGQVTAGRAVLIERRSGRRDQLEPTGWVHF